QREGLAGLALRERLADAHDRANAALEQGGRLARDGGGGPAGGGAARAVALEGANAGVERGARLARDEGVVLAVERAPLAVTHDRVAAAEVREHRSGDLAREGALRLGVHVLRGERDVR